MNASAPPPPEKPGTKTNYLLAGLVIGFGGMAVMFVANLWGRPVLPQTIPGVDPSFLEKTPWLRGYADLVAAKEDLSDFDCYACHDKNKPSPIHFDDKHRIIIPKEHKNIVMGHGSHDRNNHCYSCHKETNLLTFQVRDGRELKFGQSPPLCGSCHGPTFRDWEAGAHGRTSGHWDLTQGGAQRLACVNCHDAHSPRIPTRAPAPGPHALREPRAKSH